MKIALLAVACLLPNAAAALPTDCSKALAAGGVAEWIIGTGQATKGFLIQNIDTSEAMWYSLTGVAKAGALGSYIIPPAQARAFSNDNKFVAPSTYDFTGSVSVVAGTPGHKITCTMW